jgi:hypothetical protein
MKTSASVAWAIARAYLDDYKAALPHDVVTRVGGYLRSRAYDRLAEFSRSPSEVTEAECRVERQLAALFKKNADFANDDSCTEAARQAFERGERLCRITNKRLDHFGTQPERLAPDLRQQVARMQSCIADLLGPLHAFMDRLPESIRLTGGATEDRSRPRALPFLKISGRIRAPRLLHKLLRHLGTWFGAEGLQIVAVESNRISLVTKNWKTHRTIACEPTGSLPVQLAFDLFAKRRLRRWGIDLSSQLRNQILAIEGSLNNLLATLDLKMASDTVSYNTVALLFPSDWFQFLESTRSSGYTGPFGTGTYAKFSSMGNGATFCIETIVFAAACKAVGATTMSVYGDDIIVDASCVPALLRLLRFLGFVTNEDKSYVDGPFRESCGVDSYRGVNVTPFYLRQTPRDRSNWCHLVNGIVKIGYPGSSLWKLAARLVNQERLPLGPFGEDDTVCVHVDAHSAWTEKLLFVSDGTPYFAGLVASRSRRRNFGRRSLFLWHIKANHAPPPQRLETRALLQGWNPDTPHSVMKVGLQRSLRELKEVSEASLSEEGMPRRRMAPMAYFPPTAIEAPATLYSWTTQLSEESFRNARKIKQHVRRMLARTRDQSPSPQG